MNVIRQELRVIATVPGASTPVFLLDNNNISLHFSTISCAPLLLPPTSGISPPLDGDDAAGKELLDIEVGKVVSSRR
jgi:hypothetical protein